MATSSREARRRKIIERGSDRLAFITGQIRSIPDPPSSDSPSESQLLSDESPLPDQILPDGISGTNAIDWSRTRFCRPLIEVRRLICSVFDRLIDVRKTSSSSQQEDIADVMLDNNDTDRVGRNIHQSKAEPLQPQMSGETSTNAPASESRETIQPSPTTSTTQGPSVTDLSAPQALSPPGHLTSIITPNQIAAAIDASEYARMFFSVAIALLVILSRPGSSSLGNIINFRPVFVLLLTNATIVLSRVLPYHREDSSTASRRENSGTANEQGIADQVGYALEMALMMKKTMNAVLMDFSVYTVVVICGLVFSQSNLV